MPDLVIKDIDLKLFIPLRRLLVVLVSNETLAKSVYLKVACFSLALQEGFFVLRKGGGPITSNSYRLNYLSKTTPLTFQSAGIHFKI